MKFFKNTELAKLHNISEKSVRNWISATQKGKLDLELYSHQGKWYVANTSNNTTIIEQLVQKGKKFKNTRGYKVVVPSPKFYELYNQNQVFDMISNIDIYREIPHKYGYFDGGAVEWDLYSRKLLAEDSGNSLKNTIFLIDVNLDYIDSLLAHCRKVNIVDIGVGNGMPVRNLLEHALGSGKLGRYIAVDISQTMIDIAGQNIRKWFGDKVHFEGHIRDITQQRFVDLTLREEFGEESEVTANIILFLGGTISNFREPDQALANIHSSMGKNDIVLFSRKPDTVSARRYFDFAVDKNSPKLDFLERMNLDLMNISEEYYTVEQYFDETNMSRQIQIRMDVAIAIEFAMEGKRRVIELNKGDRILLWRAHHQSTLAILEQFNYNNFELLQATASPDQEYLLVISKIKR
jgi:uncharacterized SAM-dependent methyltransferase